MGAAHIRRKGAGPFEPQPRRTIPAWSMSVAFHAAALVAGVLLFSAESRPKPVLSKERRAEIVLVPAKTSSSAAVWLEEDHEEQSGDELQQTSGQQSLTAEATESSAAADSLPGVEAAPALAGLHLPDPGGAPIGDNGLVATPGNLGGRARPRLLPGIDEAAILAEEAARPREASPVGVPGRMSLFGAGATGRSFVFVIDRSESMGGSGLGAIDSAAGELRASIEALSDAQYFQVVAYNQAATIFARRELMPASAENKQQLVAFVRKLTAFGGTEHTYGLQAALKLRPEVIYLLTDGGDPIPNSLQRRTVQELAGGRTQIHCLHFGQGASPLTGAEFLQAVARDNRGTYTYIDMNDR